MAARCGKVVFFIQCLIVGFWLIINRSQMHSPDISPTVCRWAMTSAWSQPLLRWTVTLTVAGLLPQTRWSWPKTRVRLSPTLLLWRTPKLQFLSMHLVMRICVGWEFLIYFLCWTSSQDISSFWWFVMFFSRTFVPIFVRIKLDRIQCVQSSPCLAPYDRVDLG